MKATTNVLKIDEFPNKKSIVVTPSKMAQYYSTYPVDNEIHPLVCKSKCCNQYIPANIISHLPSSVKRADISAIPRSRMRAPHGPR